MGNVRKRKYKQRIQKAYYSGFGSPKHEQILNLPLEDFINLQLYGIDPSTKDKKKAEKKKLKEEVEEKIEKVRVEKKNKPKLVVKKRSKVQFHIGDHVRLFDGNAVGTIDSLEKTKAIVNYGTFTTQVDSDELELVKRS